MSAMEFRSTGLPHGGTPRRLAGRAGASTALLLLATLALPVRAGEPAAPPGDLTKLSLEELMSIEIPQVYSASRFEQKVTDAPASVTIVTAEDIERFGYRTLADVLASVRGFYTSYDRNYVYLGVRGFARPGDYDDRVLILLDGHRLNDTVYESASFGTEEMLDVDLIDHVEIVRGPGSSLYGTNAFFAVVDIVSKRAKDVAGLAVSAQAASFGTEAGRVTYGRSGVGGTDILVSGSAYDSSGQRLFFPEFDSPETNDGITDHCDTDRYQQVFGRLSRGNLTVEAGYSSRKKRIPTGSYGTEFNDPGNWTKDESQFLDALYGRAVGSRSRIDGHVYLDRYHYVGSYVYGEPRTALNHDEAWGDRWGADARLSTRLFDSHVFVAGIEARFDYRQKQFNYDVNPHAPYVSSDRSASVFALYAEDEFTPTKRWTLNFGLRADRFDTFGSMLNPRAGIIFKPRDRTAVKLLFGRAFRAPNAYEMYYADGYSMKGNGNLEPERIETYQAILESYRENGLRFSVSGFYDRIRDLIDLETDPSDELLFYRNLSRVRSRGVELEVGRRWSRGPEAKASYTLQKSEDETGVTLTNSPRHVVKANISAPLVGDSLMAALEVHYTSSRKTLQGNETSGFAVANLTLLSRNVVKGLAISASVYNLLDKAYSDPASGEHVQDVIPQDGRSFRLKLDYRF
jgi:outer membrane receptor for ferrienterochelin and colicins